MTTWNYDSAYRLLDQVSELDEAGLRGDDQTLVLALRRLHRQVRAALEAASELDAAEYAHASLENSVRGLSASISRFVVATEDERRHLLNQAASELGSSRDLIRDDRQTDSTQPARRSTVDALDRGLEDVRLVVAINQRLDHAMEDIARSSEAAQQAMIEARSALGGAQAAASESATSALEKDFDKVAEDESAAASNWRVFTLVTLALTLLGSVAFVFEATTREVSLQAAIFRLAVLSALAAGAAYLARQASHHRRIATWARAIQVQLRSFRGFVEKIDDRAVQDAMYELFTRRVLAPPPEHGKSSEDVTNLVQPLLEQLIKRS